MKQTCCLYLYCCPPLSLQQASRHVLPFTQSLPQQGWKAPLLLPARLLRRAGLTVACRLSLKICTRFVLLVRVFVGPFIASRYFAFIFVSKMATEASRVSKWERRFFPVKSLVLLLWESLTFSGGKNTHGLVVWLTVNAVW